MIRTLLVSSVLMLFACDSKEEDPVRKPGELSYANTSYSFLTASGGSTDRPNYDDGGDADVAFRLIDPTDTAFSIDPNTGIVTVSSGLPVGAYAIDIGIANSAGESVFEDIFTIHIISSGSAPVSIAWSIDSLVVPKSQQRQSVTPTIDDGGVSLSAIELLNAPDGISISLNGQITVAGSTAKGTYVMGVRMTNALGSTDVQNAYTVRVRSVTHTLDMQATFIENCSFSSCHGPAGNQPNWSDYNTAKNNATKIENRVLILQTMPPNGTTQAVKDLIRQWIDDGLLQ